MEKTIIITGCSSGIGLCAAETLQKRGYRVFATTRKENDVEKLKARGLESFKLDLTDSASIQQAVEEILKRTEGKLYALFNNAGFGQTGAVEDISRDALRAQFETNVFGLMELTNLIIPVMRKQGYGRIIQNSSFLGLVAMPYYGAYNASKFALEGISNTLRQELHGTNIFVSIIAPGPIHTKFRDNAYNSYKQTVNKKLSAHQEIYAKLEQRATSEHPHPFTLAPDAVVKKLIHALESPKPKAHYFVTFPAHFFALLRRLLPDSALDWIMIRIKG